MASPAKVAHDISNDNIIRTQDIEISEDVDFKGMYLSERVLKGLENSGFLRPSPIQLKSIPLGRCGLDLIVQAKAGTGKTCVFTVVALEGLQIESPATQVLVLAPTREIAFQIWQVITSIGSGMKGLTCATFIGGISLADDKENLKQCHIAVGTPGRIKCLIEHNYLKTKSIRLFVLDEADQLLDECFQADINWIYSVLPENKQILALSATYPEFMMKHVLYYMRNPTYIRLDVTQLALLGIKQYYLKIPFHPHVQKAAEYSDEAAIKILSSVSFNQCLIFSNLQSGAQSLAYKLEEQGWPTCCIAGSLEQKERNEAMASLKAFQCRVLISTDLTSRGIDAENVNLVINLDLPRKPRVYLHRIGRAGRFGSQGAAISLVPGDAGLRMLKKIQTVCNTTLKPLPDPIPHDLVTLPCEKRRIKLDDIVHTKTLSTAQLNNGKDIIKEFTRNSKSKAPNQPTDDSLSQKISSENSCKITENGTRELDKIIDNSDSPVADLPLSKSSKKSTNSSKKSTNSSKTSHKYDFPKVENSEGSLKNVQTKNSLVSETTKPKLFHPSNFLYNQELVSPWNPTEVPGFKPVSSPGSYSDLCSEFELFMCKDDEEACNKKKCNDFQAVLPDPSKLDFSLKSGICKTLDSYYKNACRALLSDGPLQEQSTVPLQALSVETVNEVDSKTDRQDCADNAAKSNKNAPYKIEVQRLFDGIGQESLNVEKKDRLKLEADQNPKLNDSTAELNENILTGKEAKKYYRHLFRREDEEYFVPDYLPYQVDEEKSQLENSKSESDKKAPQKSFSEHDKKSKKFSANKGLTKKPDVATKDKNDKGRKDKTLNLLLTSPGGNTKYSQKRSEHQMVDDDDSSSESEEFSNSQSKPADKKDYQKPFSGHDKKSQKLSANKGLTKKSDTVTKDRNFKGLKDITQFPPLTSFGGNMKYVQKCSGHQILHHDDDSNSSSESEDFSDSSASSSISESSSFTSESDSDSSSESSSEEEKVNYPCGYPLMYSQYPHPYPWTGGYPVRAPMNPNPYWTCPNYYYGYPVPFTQPVPNPKMTPDLYPSMQTLSNHYYQQQKNYIEWMTKCYLTRKQ